MQLAEYLKLTGIRRIHFARKVGVTPGYITQLCDGVVWPSRQVLQRIFDASDGAVTPNDFAGLTKLPNDTAA